MPTALVAQGPSVLSDQVRYLRSSAAVSVVRLLSCHCTDTLPSASTSTTDPVYHPYLRSDRRAFAGASAGVRVRVCGCGCGRAGQSPCNVTSTDRQLHVKQQAHRHGEPRRAR